MMLCCAAFISSGSARFIAVAAALRSPLLIASSTVRTAVRSLVRRALLTTVRRAILRVAFLAEVVLAILQKSFDRYRPRLAGLACPGAANSQSTLICVPVFSGECRLEPSMLERRGSAQRTAAAGLRPPPLAGLIDGVLASVNAFRAANGLGVPPGAGDKVLKRLNFSDRPGIA